MSCAETDIENIPLPTARYSFHGIWFTAERYRLLRWWELQLTPEQRREIGAMSIPDMIEAAMALFEDHGAR